MKRRNIYNDLTDDGRKAIDVGQVLVFERDGTREHWKVVKKAPKQVMIQETKLHTLKELDDMAGKV
jgi:hypothetical protein